jgi:hypothetical protein
MPSAININGIAAKYPAKNHFACVAMSVAASSGMRSMIFMIKKGKT